MSEFEKVYVVHELTGIISLVLPSEIENIPALKKATQKQVDAAIRAEEIAVFGESIKDGVIPEGPIATGTDDEVTNKDGADNG